MRGCGDGVLGTGIPKHQIRIASSRQHALLWIHPKNPRRRRRNQLDKPVQREISLPNPVMMQQLEPVLNAGATVGDLRKVILPQRLLVFKAERAMIC